MNLPAEWAYNHLFADKLANPPHSFIAQKLELEFWSKAYLYQLADRANRYGN